MKILDYEGLKQVVSKIKSLIDKKADKDELVDLDNSTKFIDTREKNENPEWYMKNYSRRIAKEFKRTLPLTLKDKANTEYCILLTLTGLNDSSGGYPLQICLPTNNTQIFYRFGLDKTLWSDWYRALDDADKIRRLVDLTEDSLHRTVTDTEKSKWNEISNVQKQINQMSNEINSIESKITAEIETKLKQIESAIFEDITGNPFTIDFRDIDDVTLTNGIFNEYRSRLEC